MCALGYYELYNTVCAKLKDYLCEFFVSLVDTKRFAAFTKTYPNQAVHSEDTPADTD